MRVFDPGSITLQVGALEITGFMDGSMINVVRRSEGDRVVVGGGGEAALVRSRDKSGTITFRLQHTADSNTALTAQYNLGNPVVPVFVKDLEGIRTHVSAAGVIKQIPPTDYGTDLPPREWVLECGTIADV